MTELLAERGIDIIAGGFPCQPFSHAGKRKGTRDDRYLWPEMRRIIGEVRPTWVFAENVDGLVSMAQSDWELVMEDETTICEEAEMVIETIRKDLENEGYQSIPVIIPACGVGAPHRRYRIFILGYSEHDGSHGTKIGRGVDQASNNNEKRKEETGQSTGASGRQDYETLADTYSFHKGRLPIGEKAKNTWTAISSENVVYPASEGLSKSTRVSSRKKNVTRFEYRSVLGSRKTARRSAQPRLGGVPYELSDWLDGFGMNPLDALINFIDSYPQPALLGQEQYVWEPPRVATGVKDRTARLRALGNQ